ncbi:MAG TPA: hypothetical protein VKZ59_07295, partial [Acidobacteriota bacterium]|nr:hypothetical protein [Acidobacteriota bacterium]
WYYLPVLLVGAFPWVFFTGSSVQRLWRLRRRIHDEQTTILIFLWLWVLIPLAFFSLSSSKLAGYIQPVLPALAMLSGLEWDRYIGGDVISHRLMRIELSLLAAFSIVIVLVLIVGFLLAYNSVTTGLLITLPVLAAVGIARHEYRRRRSLSLFLSLVAGMTMMAALTYWKAAPVLGAHHSTRSVVAVANPLISEEEPLVLYRYFHHSARYYSDYRTTVEAVSGHQELEMYMRKNPQERYLLLTQEPGWNELRQQYPSLELMFHEGNLYLTKIPGPTVSLEQ